MKMRISPKSAKSSACWSRRFGRPSKPSRPAVFVIWLSIKEQFRVFQIYRGVVPIRHTIRFTVYPLLAIRPSVPQSDKFSYPLADNGSMHLWDWKTGYNFQRVQAAVQPGSLDSEAGIFSMTFDMSGCRLITTEADKTIKIYKEDDTAVNQLLKIVLMIVQIGRRLKSPEL